MRDWKELKDEIEEIAYGDMGIVTQLRDGYTGPDEESNAKLISLCKEAREMIRKNQVATSDQYSFFLDLVYEIMKFAEFDSWVADYGDELTDALMTE